MIEKAAASKGTREARLCHPISWRKQRRIDAEAKAERERIAAEARQGEQEAAAAGVEPKPVEELPPQNQSASRLATRSRATALRTVKVAEITDLPPWRPYLAGMGNPPPDFVEVARSWPRR